MPNLIGTAADQVPTNGSLGNMAFQNKEGVITDLLSTTALTVTGTGVMSVGGTQIYKDASGNYLSATCKTGRWLLLVAAGCCCRCWSLSPVAVPGCCPCGC